VWIDDPVWMGDRTPAAQVVSDNHYWTKTLADGSERYACQATGVAITYITDPRGTRVELVQRAPDRLGDAEKHVHEFGGIAERLAAALARTPDSEGATGRGAGARSPQRELAQLKSPS